MAWFGPSGDCGCCEPADCLCADPSEHSLANLTYTTPSGAGVATIKVTISDIQDEINFRYRGSPQSGALPVNDTTITGLDSLNGTHYIGIAARIPATPSICIPKEGLYGIEQSYGTWINKTYQIDVDMRELWIPTCSLSGVYGTSSGTFSMTGPFADIDRSLFYIDRTTLNDVIYKCTLRGRLISGNGTLYGTRGRVDQELSIKCSEDFEPDEKPLMLTVNQDPYTSGSCTLSEMPPTGVLEVAVGTVRMELVLI